MSTKIRTLQSMILNVTFCVLVVPLLGGCGSPAADAPGTPEITPTETAVPEATATSTPTPLPTETPLPLPTETPSPTRTSTPVPTQTPSPTPTPEPSNVFGNLSLSFKPYDDTVVIPESPGELTLQVKSKLTDEVYEVIIPDGQTAFSAALPPGPYVMQTLYISALDVTPSVEAGTFEVPETGCVHIGHIALSYHRLPPGNLFEQIGLAQKIAQGRDILLTYLESGSLFLDTAKVSNPTPGTLQEDAQSCNVQSVILP